MTTPSTLTFRLNIVILVLAILCVAAGGGLGLVTMRIEIEQTAANALELEAKRKDLRRLDRFHDARIAQAHQPKALMKKVADLGLDLQPPRPQQVVHLRDRLEDRPFSNSTLTARREGSERELHRLAHPTHP